MSAEPPRDLIGLLTDEFIARCRLGECPSVDEYANRCPEYAEHLRALLPLVALLHRAATSADPEDGDGDGVSTASGAEADGPLPPGPLLQRLYADLRQMAARLLSREKEPGTLCPTALVHEAYLRVVGADPGRHWDGKGHFFAAAAEAMRRLLVERARRRKRLRHGGGRTRVELSEDCATVAPPSDDLLALDEALQRLTVLAPAKAELVKLRYFAGLTVAEAAEVLSISEATAARYWQFARVWLYAEMKSGGAPPAEGGGDAAP